MSKKLSIIRAGLFDHKIKINPNRALNCTMSVFRHSKASPAPYLSKIKEQDLNYDLNTIAVFFFTVKSFCLPFVLMEANLNIQKSVWWINVYSVDFGESLVFYPFVRLVIRLRYHSI